MTSVIDRPGVHGGGVEQIRAAIDAVLADDPAEWSLDLLEQALPDLHVLTNKLAALQVRVLASFDARGGAQIAGARSTGDWLAKATGTPGSHAGWLVHTARDLREHLPGTAAALADGDIGLDHVRAIRGAWRQLDKDRFADAEQDIVDFARRRDVRDLRALLDLMIQNYRKDDHDSDCEQARRGNAVARNCPTAWTGGGTSTGSSTRPRGRRWPQPWTSTPTRPDPMTPAPLPTAPSTPWPRSPPAPWTPLTGPPAWVTSP
jgi:hypothetical protein